MTIIRSTDVELGAHVIRLEGEIDIASVGDLNDRVAAVAAACPEVVALDLRDVTFIDSTGLSALVLANGIVRDAGSSLVLRAVPPCVLRPLQLTRLDAHLHIEGLTHS